MRLMLCPLIRLFVAHILLFCDVQASHHEFRVKPRRRRGQVPDWPFAFFVSHENWCMTAKNGVKDGSQVGYDRCDFKNAPNTQLFLLNSNGKIHSAVDKSKCVVVDKGTSIDQGHSPLRFEDCSDLLPYSTFLHDRESPSFLQVKQNTTFCIKQNGNGPDATDALRAFACPTDAQARSDDGFMFEYREHACSTNLDDVSCCNDRDCRSNGSNGEGTCQDYSCVCTTVSGTECCSDSDCSLGRVCRNNACIAEATGRCNTRFPGTECCEDDDCPLGRVCENEACVAAGGRCNTRFPGTECCDDEDCSLGRVCENEACVAAGAPNLCNVTHFGTDCCDDTDCPANYNCESKTCMTPPFFLVSDDALEGWCISVTTNVNGGVQQDGEASFERCRASGRARQLWHQDLFGRFRSNVDKEMCLIVGPGIDRNGIVEIRLASCDFNTAFSYDAFTTQVRFVEDETYCLSSYDESIDGVIHGQPCESAGVVKLQLF